MEHWTVQNSRDLYRIHDWGDGYFDVNEAGNIVVKPNADSAGCDLDQLVQDMTRRGIHPPILFRFEGIIWDRLRFLFESFDAAIKEFEYEGNYRLAFPIKVNQQRHVVDSLRAGMPNERLGLEVGSKPELVAVLAIHDTPNGLLLCNGYKDQEYIELALLSRRLGRRTIITVEQLYELEQILDLAEKLGIEPEIGLRFKPSRKGQGRWESSGGDKAKFGLTAHEVVIALELLARRKASHCLKLLHFHTGSQITSIAAIKRVLREATRMYTEVAKECPSLCFLDVGGGLAVDYDGSRTSFESSMNYTVGEYARDVIYAIGEACREAGVPQPDIITESGRAVLAHHAVLVAEVTDIDQGSKDVPDLEAPPSDHHIIADLTAMIKQLTVKNCQETFHDAIEIRQAIRDHFNLGSLSLRERAFAERVYRKLLAKIVELSKQLRYVPEDLEKTGAELVETVFCNFSVFQSVPDFWAIGNLFPIVPIQRLNEQPNLRAVIADLTCDSDGKIDRFIDLKDVSRALPMHEVSEDENYYLAIFLVGAYQEILGDLHNLFGDTNAVHVHINPDGSYTIPAVVEGDTVREVLEYVQYDSKDLLERLRVSIEKAMTSGTLSAEESAQLQRRYRDALDGYTYLVK